jgi:histidyl-tRNA synthetase
MSSKLQPVRGTHDILPDEFEKFHEVIKRARAFATLYGFREMSTPIFEMAEVFSRSMGETSDVVSKEMFAFETKGGEPVCLRPEFTAGVARAFISNGMQQHLPLKLFSTGPLFRYERPQKGRQRQFHQVNFEWLGDASIHADIETIRLAGKLLFSLTGKPCKFLINSLGDRDSREKYRNALVTYLTPHAANLSEDSQRRLSENPLRILDSKDPRDKEITINAPRITDYLNDASKLRLETICASLQMEKDDFHHLVHLDQSLVRGLDYYTDIVFEFVADIGDLGAQNTVLAGGRYDGLVEQMGGKPTPAIGFAAGVERLLLMLASLNPPEQYRDVRIMVIPTDDADAKFVYIFSDWLRIRLYDACNMQYVDRKCIVEVLWEGSHKKRMERADKRGATHVFMVEKDGTFRVQDMTSRQTLPAFTLKEASQGKRLAEFLGL